MIKVLKLLAACLLMLSAAATQASTVLAPTNEDVNFIVSDNNYTIGIFDEADTAFQNNLNVNMGYLYTDYATRTDYYSGLISFSPWPETTGPYTASNGTLNLDLGVTTNFIVALYDGSKWIADSGVIEGSNGNVSVLMFDISTDLPGQGEKNVVAVDVQMSPVPVPAAVWLFATGLIGLAGIARRRV